MGSGERSSGARASAEAVWLAAVGRAGGDAAPDVEALCRAHPELARELCAVAAEWRWLEEHVRRPPGAGAEGVALRGAARGLDAERYTRLAEVARGGGGQVQRIWDSLLGRSLAMKVAHVPLRSGEGSQSRSVARFLDEARVTGQLQHPGVVPLHDVGIDEHGFAFFTMDLVEGIELGEAFRRVRRGDPDWTLQRAVRALASVADTLAYAHDRGVLHRDVKPSNVMVGPFGEVYVMDWGLARHEREPAHADPPPAAGPRRPGTSAYATADGALIGTPAYMPPEQARGDLAALDGRADVYAVGAMLYELLAGRAPYADERRSSGASRADDVAQAVALRAPRPLAALAPGAPAELVAVAERAMARRPEERYGDMQALARELRAYLEGRVVRAHRTGVLVEVQKWVQRNRLSAAALALLIAALAASAWVRLERARSLRTVNEQLNESNAALGAARTEALGEAYFARLAAAQASLLSGDGRSAAYHVDACAPELRGWGWRHVSARAENHESSDAIELGFGAPGSFDLSDGGRFAAGHLVRVPHLEHGVEAANRVVLYDFEAGDSRVLFDLGGAVEARCVPRTELLLVALREGARVFDCAAGGALLAAVETSADELAATLLAVSADGRSLVHATAGPALDVRRTPDLALTARIELEGGAPGPRSLALSPDGAWIACLDEQGTLLLLDARDGARRGAIPTGPPDRTSFAPRLAFRGDGALLAVGLSGVRIELFAVPDGEPLGSLSAFEERICALAYDATGRRLACGGWNGAVAVLDAESGAPLFRGRGHTGMVTEIGWRPDGRVWSASRDGTLRTWRPERGNGFDVLRAGRDAAPVVDPLRERVASIDPGGVLLLWDAATGDVIARQDYASIERFSPLSAAFVPTTGELLVTTRYSGLLRLAADTLAVRAQAEPSGGQRLAVAADGRRCAYDRSGEIRVTRVADLATEARITDVEAPTAYAFDAGGDGLWIAGMAGTLEHFTLASSPPVRLHALSYGVGVASLARRGDVLAVGLTSGEIELRSAVDGALLGAVGRGSAAVESLSFHPREPVLLSSATSSAGDTGLRLFDTERLQLRCELVGPDGRLRTAAFGGDGSYVVARASSREGFVLLDDRPRYRGVALVEAARERVLARLDELWAAWPHPAALALAWSRAPGLTPEERRAGHGLAFERRARLDDCVRAVAALARDRESARADADAASVLARFVAELAPEERARADAQSVLAYVQGGEGFE